MKDFTVKKMAELLSLSKPTIQKVINEKQLKPVRVEKNKYNYYSIEQLEVIVKELESDFDVSILLPNTAKSTANLSTNGDNAEKLATVVDKISDKPQKDSDTVSILLDMLQKELDKKEKQIERLEKRVEKLEETNEQQTQEIIKLANQASYITAVDKTAQIIDKKQENSGDVAGSDNNNKKRWFNFWK